tara:strand:- start:6722 stop:7771 length:1050 start_codon:yes stop_codon:yes gene_type:complete
MKETKEQISAKGVWKVRRECSYDENGLNLDDFKDIAAEFFFDSRFKSGDSFNITTPSKVLIQLPKAKVSWTKKTGFFRNLIDETNTSFITNKKHYKNIVKQDKNEQKKYWEQWFSCFFHPTIYLEFEKLILHTEFKKRYSEQKDDKPNKTDDYINKSTRKLFQSFCKSRTKFIKCYTDTVKPAFFCQGLFAQLPKDSDVRDELIELLKSLGHTTIDKEMEEFSENENVDPITRASEDRKKRFDEKPVKNKSLEEEIEETKAKLVYLEKEKEDNEELDILDDELKSLKDNKFGKALHSTATVLTLWKKAKTQKDYKNAIKLFKMYEAISFKNKKERKLLHNLMLRNRNLF